MTAVDDRDLPLSVARIAVDVMRALTHVADVHELVQIVAERTRERFVADDVAIMLVGDDGALHVVAATSHGAELADREQLHAMRGPCMDAFTSADLAVVPQVEEAPATWAAWAAEAARHGFGSAISAPLVVDDRSIGTMNLLARQPGTFTPELADDVQVLATAAALAVVVARNAHDEKVLSEQLQQALTSRVVIEQAKGVLAERHGIPPDRAFAALRRFARDNRRPVAAVAREIVDGVTELQVTGS